MLGLGGDSDNQEASAPAQSADNQEATMEAPAPEADQAENSQEDQAGGM
jgi:hypothetical protein